MGLAVLVTALLALFAGACGVEKPDDGDGEGAAAKLASFGLSEQKCDVEGDVRVCSLVMGSSDVASVRTASGTETCRTGRWTQCRVPEDSLQFGEVSHQVSLATPSGQLVGDPLPPEHPLLNLDAGSCMDPNDPSCVLLDDNEGATGLQSTASSNSAWRINTKLTNAAVGNASGCGTLGDCEYGTYCQNPETCLPVGAACATNAQCCGANNCHLGHCITDGCAHDKCGVGVGLDPTACTDTCVQAVCNNNPTLNCCAYAGGCSHDPCAEGNPLNGLCDLIAVAPICLTNPSCCLGGPHNFWTAECAAAYGNAKFPGVGCYDPQLQWSEECIKAVHDNCDMCIPGTDTSVFASSTTKPLCSQDQTIVITGTADITLGSLYGGNGSLKNKTLIINDSSGAGTQLTLNGGEPNVAQLLSDINQQWPDLIATKGGGNNKELVLTGAQGVSLTIGNGTANVLLGLPNGATEPGCCVHDPCITGAALNPGCDAINCVQNICNTPGLQHCCQSGQPGWDASCVANIPGACGTTCPVSPGVCTPWAPIQVDADCNGPDLVAGVPCFNQQQTAPAGLSCGPYSCGDSFCDCGETNATCPVDCPASSSHVIALCNVGTADTPAGQPVVVNVYAPQIAPNGAPGYPPNVTVGAAPADCNVSGGPPCTCTLNAPSPTAAAIKNGTCVDLVCPTVQGDQVFVNPPGHGGVCPVCPTGTTCNNGSCQILECGQAVSGPIDGAYSNNWSVNLDSSATSWNNLAPGAGTVALCKAPTCSPSTSSVIASPHQYHLTIVAERSNALGGPNAHNGVGQNIWANIQGGIVGFLLDPKTSVAGASLSNVAEGGAPAVPISGATTPHIALGVFPDNQMGDQCEAMGGGSCPMPSPSTPFVAANGNTLTPANNAHPMPCVGLGFSGGMARGWFPIVVNGGTNISAGGLYGAGGTLNGTKLTLNVDGAGAQTLTLSGTGNAATKAAFLAAVNATWPKLVAYQALASNTLVIEDAAGTSIVVGSTAPSANGVLGLATGTTTNPTPAPSGDIVLPGLPNGNLANWGLSCTSNTQCCSGQCNNPGPNGQCNGGGGSKYCMAAYVLNQNQSGDPPPYSSALAGALEVATNDRNSLPTLLPQGPCNVNGVQDHNETGVDCGGVDCPPCPSSGPTITCGNNAPTNQGDCISGYCNPSTDVCQAPAGNRTDEMVVLILGSDQTATDNNGHLINGYCNPSVAAMAGQAATAFATSGVRTSVIAVGPAQQSTANMIAAAGGGLGIFIQPYNYTPFQGSAGGQDIATQVEQALADIRDSIYPCAVNLPPPALFNQANALVYYDGTTTGNIESPFTQVTSAGACTAAGGWFYNTPTNPSQMILCPSTCTQLRNDTTVITTYQLGCPGHFSTSGTQIPAYTGVCPTEGTQVQWTALGWDMSTTPAAMAPGPSIGFQVQTGAGTPPAFGATYNVANASFPTDPSCLIYTNTPPTPGSACYANLVKILNGVDSFDGGLPNGDAVNPELNLLVTLNPDPNATNSAVLNHWQLTYDCPFVQ